MSDSFYFFILGNGSCEKRVIYVVTFAVVFNLILKPDLLDRSKKFIDPLYQVWEDMSAEELQEFKKPIKKVNL